MGFLDDMFGNSDVQRRVQSYFKGGNSNYEAFRKCIHEMIALRMNESLTQQYFRQIQDELYIQLGGGPGDMVMKMFFSVAMLRVTSSLAGTPSVNLIYLHGQPNLWADSESRATKHKPSGMLRFDLLVNDRIGFAWAALYDDGTRMSKTLPGVEGPGWKVALSG